MKTTISKSLKKFVAVLMTLAMMVSVGNLAVSAEGTGGDNGGIATYSYYSGTAFSFSDYNIGYARTFDGNKIAFEINASSTTASTIKVEVHIDNSTVYTYDVPVNSGTLKYDHIPMGYTGDHSVYFIYRVNGSATINSMVMYSWTD